MAFKIFFAILILLPILATAQTNQNVSLGSSIVANRANSTRTSPSGEFAFGFQEIVPGQYLLAIWFNNIPERTIVWSANRDNLAEQGSRIQLLPDGTFQLFDPNGRQIWTASFTASSSVAYGAMLDNGNFVLVNRNSAVLWQSFDNPTDTLLPDQTFNLGGVLVSRFSETNYSRGRFRFDLQSVDGNLLLYTRNFPLDDRIFAYWSTQTMNVGFQVSFNQSGQIFLTARNGTILTFMVSDEVSSSDFYQRAILEYDGVFRRYIYPRSANSRNGRVMGWSVLGFFPSNICTRIGDYTGLGACGFNSLCSLGSDQRPVCECPNGYSLIDPTDRIGGCKPDFVQQSCDQELSEPDHFNFIEMHETDWPGSNYELFQPVNETWCRRACLTDCFCAVAVYRNTSCWKKKFPLSNGRVSSDIQGTTLVKVRVNNTRTNNSDRRSVLNITRSVLLGSSVFLNLFLISLVSFFIFRFKKSISVTPVQVLPGLGIRTFSFTELLEATSGFNEQLGSGASSTVYKGVLNNENGKQIAVKKLGELDTEAEKEFKAEVSSISRTNHKNLVQLLGYCDEGPNKLLVYEFMTNSSLSSFLFENSRPNWYTRVQIALGIARGICYLHEECSTQIIHCDIKPQNVLLDMSLTAKISDFGLAKLLKPDETRTITTIRGTRGYVAPEWFRNMPVTVKVDVYSFGILLLELICCRRNVKKEVEDESREILSYWAYDCYREGRVELLVDDDEEAMNDTKRFEKFVMIGIWCIQDDPLLRPNMKRIVNMLEGSVEVPNPPDPDPGSFISY